MRGTPRHRHARGVDSEPERRGGSPDGERAGDGTRGRRDDGVRGGTSGRRRRGGRRAPSERCGRWWGTTRGFAPWRIPRRRATRRTPRRKSRGAGGARRETIASPRRRRRETNVFLLLVASQLAGEPGVPDGVPLPRRAHPRLLLLVRERVDRNTSFLSPMSSFTSWVYFLANTARSAGRFAPTSPRSAPSDANPERWPRRVAGMTKKRAAHSPCRNTCPL